MQPQRRLTKALTTLERPCTLFIQVLIVLSLISLSLDTLPDLAAEHRRYLKLFEHFCLATFTFEYFIRLGTAKNKRAFAFSFLGIIDLLVIFPFYLFSSIDLMSLRALRLLRLIRILKLARYNAAARRLQRAFLIAKEELLLFMGATIILIYLSSVGIYFFENPAQPEQFKSVFHSLWWSVATLTTVGYGDIYPVTIGGKIFTFIMLIIGLGIVSIPAGLIASALGKARELDD